MEKVHDMQEVHQNKSVHAIATSMAFTRVSSDHLPDDGPQKHIRICNFRVLVSIKDENLKEIQNQYKIFVARTLIQKFPEFQHLKSYLSKECCLHHPVNQRLSPCQY